jgi:hypothetical protein
MKYLKKFNELFEANLIDKSEKWSVEFALINLYYYKFGLGEFGIFNHQDLAKILDSNDGTIDMHNRQFVRLGVESGKLVGGTDSGLGKIGYNIRLAFYKYDNLPKNELKPIVEDILDKIETGYTNQYFLKDEKEDKQLLDHFEDEWRKKTNKQPKKELELELKNIIKNYSFEIDEIVTLKHKSWKTSRVCIITKGGKINEKPEYVIEEGNGGPYILWSLSDYDVIFPHNLPDKYNKIVIGHENWYK